MLRSSATNISICIDHPREYYTNGDYLRGVVLVENSKPQSVQNIEIKLRCEEFAHVWVPNGQGGHYESETLKYLSLRRTVFPLKSLRYHPDSDPNARYTIQSGSHEFPFEFRIPVADRYPPSLSIKGAESGIKWCLKVAMHRGQVLLPTKRTTFNFEMRPAYRLEYSGSRLLNVEETRPMLVYLPGYAEWLKTTSAKLKDKLPGYRHLRKRTNVHVTAAIAKEGLLQAPHPLTLYLNAECETPEDSELMLVRGLEIELKQKAVVSVNEGWDNTTYRNSFVLVRNYDLNYPLKEGLDKLEQIILAAKIEGRLPATLTNSHFALTYKLVLVLILGNREKPSATERIRLSVPTHLHGFIPAVFGDEDDNTVEALPTYHRLPMQGEEIVNDAPEYGEPSKSEVPDDAATSRAADSPPTDGVLESTTTSHVTMSTTPAMHATAVNNQPDVRGLISNLSIPHQIDPLQSSLSTSSSSSSSSPHSASPVPPDDSHVFSVNNSIDHLLLTDKSADVCGDSKSNAFII